MLCRGKYTSFSSRKFVLQRTSMSNVAQTSYGPGEKYFSALTRFTTWKFSGLILEEETTAVSRGWETSNVTAPTQETSFYLWNLQAALLFSHDFMYEWFEKPRREVGQASSCVSARINSKRRVIAHAVIRITVKATHGQCYFCFDGRSPVNDDASSISKSNVCSTLRGRKKQEKELFLAYYELLGLSSSINHYLFRR